MALVGKTTETYQTSATFLVGVYEQWIACGQSDYPRNSQP